MGFFLKSTHKALACYDVWSSHKHSLTFVLLEPLPVPARLGERTQTAIKLCNNILVERSRLSCNLGYYERTRRQPYSSTLDLP